MHIRCVTTGRVRGKRHTGPLRYLPGGWSDETLPVHAFAVDHPDGVCLFDTGQTARASHGGYHPRWHPYLRLARFELEPEDEVASQLDPLTRALGRALSPAHRPRRRPLRVHARGGSRLRASSGSARRASEDASAATSPSTGRPGSLLGSSTSPGRPLGPSPPLTTSRVTAACSWCRFPGTHPATPACSWTARRCWRVTRRGPAVSLRVLEAHDPRPEPRLGSADASCSRRPRLGGRGVPPSRPARVADVEIVGGADPVGGAPSLVDEDDRRRRRSSRSSSCWTRPSRSSWSSERRRRLTPSSRSPRWRAALT